MITRRLTIALMGFGLALFAAPQVVLAANEHLEQAISETKKAIEYGEEPHHASSFIEHVENAIGHAESAQKQEPSLHIERGIKHLRSAKKIAYDTHSTRRLKAAAKHAKKALSEFEAVK